MTTARTQTIEALAKIIAECKSLLDQVLEVNEVIREKKLPVPGLPILGIFETQRVAETVLLEMELRAGVSA